MRLFKSGLDVAAAAAAYEKRFLQTVLFLFFSIILKNGNGDKIVVEASIYSFPFFSLLSSLLKEKNHQEWELIFCFVDVMNLSVLVSSCRMSALHVFNSLSGKTLAFAQSSPSF